MTIFIFVLQPNTNANEGGTSTDVPFSSSDEKSAHHRSSKESLKTGEGARRLSRGSKGEMPAHRGSGGSKEALKIGGNGRHSKGERKGSKDGSAKSSETCDIVRWNSFITD